MSQLIIRDQGGDHDVEYFLRVVSLKSLQVGWLVVLRINVDLAIFQPYLDLEAGDNQSLKIQVARPGIEPRSSCSASQELKSLQRLREIKKVSVSQRPGWPSL